LLRLNDVFPSKEMSWSGKIANIDDIYRDTLVVSWDQTVQSKRKKPNYSSLNSHHSQKPQPTGMEFMSKDSTGMHSVNTSSQLPSKKVTSDFVPRKDAPEFQSYIHKEKKDVPRHEYSSREERDKRVMRPEPHNLSHNYDYPPEYGYSREYHRDPRHHHQDRFDHRDPYAREYARQRLRYQEEAMYRRYLERYGDPLSRRDRYRDPEMSRYVDRRSAGVHGRVESLEEYDRIMYERQLHLMRRREKEREHRMRMAARGARPYEEDARWQEYYRQRENEDRLRRRHQRHPGYESPSFV